MTGFPQVISIFCQFSKINSLLCFNTLYHCFDVTMHLLHHLNGLYSYIKINFP